MAGRCYKALAEGESDPAALAARAHHTLRATPEQLCDALGACAELNPVYRQLLKMSLKELQLMEEQIDQLDQQLASWVGVCPGQEQSAEQSTSDRSPKANRTLRRLLNQAAYAQFG